jgi:hypothetical protein
MKKTPSMQQEVKKKMKAGTLDYEREDSSSSDSSSDEENYR